jgi:hypothetical protein
MPRNEAPGSALENYSPDRYNSRHEASGQASRYRTDDDLPENPDGAGGSPLGAMSRANGLPKR